MTIHFCVTAAVQHAVSAHERENTGLAGQIKSILKDESDSSILPRSATRFLQVAPVACSPLRPAPPLTGARCWKVYRTMQPRRPQAGKNCASGRARSCE